MHIRDILYMPCHSVKSVEGNTISLKDTFRRDDLLSTAFDQTTGDPLKLGSLTMGKFAQDSPEKLDGFDIRLAEPMNPHTMLATPQPLTCRGTGERNPKRRTYRCRAFSMASYDQFIMQEFHPD